VAEAASVFLPESNSIVLEKVFDPTVTHIKYGSTRKEGVTATLHKTHSRPALCSCQRAKQRKWHELGQAHGLSRGSLLSASLCRQTQQTSASVFRPAICEGQALQIG
jgi:hypothetical protein